MNDDERPPGIEAVDHLDVGPAPVGDLLHAGHTTRRRRRTVIAGVAAVTVLLVGGGFVTTQVLGDDANGDDVLVADDNDPAVRDLRVEVRAYDPATSQTLLYPNSAVWGPETHVLVYNSAVRYASSCVPTADVVSTGDEALLLNVREQSAVADCVGAEVRVMVTVRGLTDPPTELVVTEDGKEHTVPVAGAEPTDFTAQCSSGMSSSGIIDFIGPASPADVKDWPTTPGDAARQTLEAEVFAGFDAPVLGEPEPVSRPEASTSVGRKGIRYDVFEYGMVAGRITVEEVGYGAYATTIIEQCASSTAGPGTVAVELPVSGWDASDPSFTALISGVLSVDENDCVYLASGDTAARTYAAWPAGFSATLDDGHLTLFDRGDPVAHDGDHLSMGGGYAANPGTEPCLPESATGVATVMSGVEVQGS